MQRAEPPLRLRNGTVWHRWRCSMRCRRRSMVVLRWLSTVKPSWPDSPRHSGASRTRFIAPAVKRTHDSPSPRGHTQFLRTPPAQEDCITMIEVEKPDLGHRRHAIQIVAQLPEVQADALLILEAARD